jgi:hypothetical protein
MGADMSLRAMLAITLPMHVHRKLCHTQYLLKVAVSLNTYCKEVVRGLVDWRRAAATRKGREHDAERLW